RQLGTDYCSLLGYISAFTPSLRGQRSKLEESEKAKRPRRGIDLTHRALVSVCRGVSLVCTSALFGTCRSVVIYWRGRSEYKPQNRSSKNTTKYNSSSSRQ
ncbi:hypothetical protein ACHAXN_004736, partial [Cyclotella atomus]